MLPRGGGYAPRVFVCLCKAVRDGTIVAAIDDGAKTLDQVAEACGAGSVCGTCRPLIADLLEEVREKPGAERS